MNPQNAKMAVNRTIERDMKMMLKSIEEDMEKIESQQNKYWLDLEQMEQKECLMNMTGEHMSSQLTAVEKQTTECDQFIQQHEHSVLTTATLPTHL